MKAQLALLGGPKVIELPTPHFVWPRITPAVERAIVTQLHAAIGIQDRSGIFEEFESEFAAYHNRSRALLFNSGTSAIYAMYHGIGLEPGDQVLCPVYTFFATVSPMMHLGAVPVFCDCRSDGNIDPHDVEKRITSKTKALIVTHVWGKPCDMDAIVGICKRHKLKLLEDCSHAHGARFHGRLVGTFGDVAAWSLERKKLVTGGEGGILLTDSDEIYHRGVLLGHYNRRSRQEIPLDHPLSQYNLTGLGLKLRAHPLAVAIAQEQFKHLDEWLVQRRAYAMRMAEAFQPFAFLSTPSQEQCESTWRSYVMNYEETYSHGVSVDVFVKAVEAEGLHAFGQPRSTRPLHRLPLFTDPQKVLPHLYREPLPFQQGFPVAQKLYDNAVRLTVPSFADEADMVDSYIRGIVKVASVVRDSPRLLRPT